MGSGDLTGSQGGSLVEGETPSVSTEIRITYDADLPPVTQDIVIGEAADGTAIAGVLATAVDAHPELNAVQGGPGLPNQDNVNVTGPLPGGDGLGGVVELETSTTPVSSDDTMLNWQGKSTSSIGNIHSSSLDSFEYTGDGDNPVTVGMLLIFSSTNFNRVSDTRSDRRTFRIVESVVGNNITTSGFITGLSGGSYLWSS